MYTDINGLILTGGESARMGIDKGGISYHGVPQRDYLAGLVSKVTGDAYLSCHPERVPESSYPILGDFYLDMGPMGGLLTAFGMDAESAWFTLPCDMPLVDMEIIEELLEAREKSKIATCFLDPESGNPEPLFVIWEHSALPVLLKSKDAGSFSLKKILMDVDCKLVMCAHPEKLRNVNTREEYEEVMNGIEDGMEIKKLD